MKTGLRVTLLFILLATAINFAKAASAFPVLVAVTQVICPGANTGSINITPGGGTGPYTYSWSNDSTTQNLSNLVSGTYFLTITDNTGAQAFTSVTITQPSQFSVSKTITNENCGGDAIGTVQISVSGSTPGYTYIWNTGDTTTYLSNLTAAEYYVTITDANGCKTTDSANVTQPPGVVINSTITNENCSSGNGSISISLLGGQPGFSFLWNDGATTQNRAALHQGTYRITVTDTIGCSASANEVVGEAPNGMSASYHLNQPSCYNYNDGKIWMTSVVGSIGPYTFAWNDGDTSRSRTNMSAGTYIVTAISGAGCTTIDTLVLGQPSGMNISLVAIPLTCYQSGNGAINTTVTNGSSPYTYNWGGGVTSKNRTLLAIGTYTITVTDLNGCSLSASTAVTQPSQITPNAVATAVTCAGGNTGSVTTGTTGGTGPYSYWWGAGITSQNQSNINAGNYTVTVTDAHGCTGTASATVAAYTPMTLSAAKTNAACNGNNTGSVNLTVTNGIAPYSYLWSNGDTTLAISSLGAGIYSVTVTDNKACTVSASYTLTQPPFPITINATLVDVNCNGNNNGSITVTPSNGASPYSYNWGGGITLQNRTNLSPNNYNLTVTDFNGCTAIGAYSITQPLPITITLTDTNVTCFGGNNGAIGTMATGSYPPFAYNWGGGKTSQNRTNIVAGNYTVTITDNHGCSATATTAITQPTKANITSAITTVSCNGGNTGTVNLTVTGATSPYTFNWSNGLNTQNISNLIAATYNVTVTDNASCTFSASATVSQPAAISITAAVTNVACNGGNTGAINLTVTGGVSPYGFNWGGGITTQNRNNLTAGSYNVTVTDNVGCTASGSYTITQSIALGVTTTATNITCNGANNGSINTTVTGGTTPYTYDWGGGIVTPNRTNLSTGNYTATVTDSAGCSVTGSSAITEPTVLTVTATATNVNCNGGNTGAVNLTVTGGTPAYSYNWSGGIVTQNRNNIIAGTYNVTVTDNAGCSVTTSATVTQPSVITVSLATTNVSCNGSTNGSITSTINGGAGGYSYNWGGGITTPNRTNLNNGSYTLTVTDGNFCTATGTSTITQPSAISVTLLPVSATCFGVANGTINNTTIGGAGPYNYKWSDSTTAQNLTNAIAGTYAVTITDAHFCTATNSTAISQPTQVTVSTTAQNVNCNGAATGAVTTTTAGGTGNYTYVWSNGAFTQNLNNVTAAAYTVTVNDANHCSATSSSVVTQPAVINVTGTVTNATCFGGNTGAISTTTTGGNGGFTYLWNTGAITANISNLVAGNYSLNVHDATGCPAVYSGTVSQPTQIVISAATTNVSCNGANTGAINLTVTGGTGNYTFDWGGGITPQNRNNLTAGNYSVTVLDGSACSATALITITQTAPIVITLTPTNVGCFGQSTGGITLNVTGGNGGNTFNWSNNSHAQNLANVAAANYTVTVTDITSCSATVAGSVTQPTQITTSGVVTNATCNGSATGGVTLTVNGGSPGYTFKWSDNSTNQNLQSVIAANYNVTVTDINACKATNSFTITQPSAVVVTATSNNVNCFGNNNGSVTTSTNGGSGGYTYNWSNNATSASILNLAPGTYTVTVKDASSCSATVSGTVTQPAVVSATPVPQNVSCNGAKNGALSLNVTGGTIPYSYNWNNNSTAPQLNNLSPNTYSVVVTDAHSCTATATAAITEPAVLVVSEQHADYACGSNQGTITVTPTGGTGPYHYGWNGGSTGSSLTNLKAGNYTVTVTDVNSCSATSTIAINSLPPLNVILSETPVSCYNGHDGLVNVSTQGGTPPFSYKWNSKPAGSNIPNLTAGSYSVSVTDSNNCVATATATVSQPKAIVITPVVTPISCKADNYGTINISVSGGTPGYSYLWSTFDTTQNMSNLSAGKYALTVTDASSCSASSSINIDPYVPVTATTNATAIGCSNGGNGSVTLAVSGGNPPYVFDWSNQATTQDISGLNAGTYTVTITDSKNCSANSTATVTAGNPVTIASAVQNASCKGVDNGSIDLTVSGGTAAYHYRWNNGAISADITNVAPGNYSVTVTDALGCSTTSGFAITTDYVLEVHATGSTTITEGQSVEISATANVDHNNVFSWSPNGYVTCSNCATTQAAPVRNTVFTVMVTDANGCKATDNVTIDVNTQTTIFIPNAFSPNADGNNDFFQIFGNLSPIVKLDMMVFDRWGEKVFESEEPQFKWDGTYRGQPEPMGVFVYTMQASFEDGTHQDYKGSVTLVR